MSLEDSPDSRLASPRLRLSWDNLVDGTPTIIAFAELCCAALAGGARPPGEASAGELSLAAKAILFAARQRGCIELKATKNAYDSAQRLLAVHVETGPERMLAFRSRQEPHFTLQMLEAFRELCASGLILHSHGREFSLTHPAMQLAAAVAPPEVATLLAQALELDFEN